MHSCDVRVMFVWFIGRGWKSNDVRTQSEENKTGQAKEGRREGLLEL